MSTPATPFAPPRTDEERLKRALQTLCNLPRDDAAYNNSPVVRALTAAGITEFEGQFAMLSLRQIETLSYDRAGTTTLLTIAERSLLHAVVAFFHETSRRMKKKVEICRTTKNLFDLWRVSEYVPSEEVTPYGRTPTRGATTDLEVWQKRLSLDPKAYPDLQDDAFWPKWKKSMHSTIDSHAIRHLITLNHVVKEPDLDELQRKWFYNVLKIKCKTGTAKAIINAHETDKDTRRIWHELVQAYDNSATAEIRQQKISTWLTSTRLVDGWKGTQHSYILYFDQQMSIYNELSSAAYTPQQCCEFLQSAVTGVPNLENIKTNIIASQRSAGSSVPISS